MSPSRSVYDGEPVIELPLVPWDEFLANWRWLQGEHVTLIGPTGLGKTTLALQILDKRGHVMIFATKPKDEVLDGLKQHGYRIFRDWPPPLGKRLVFWPHIDEADKVMEQREKFRNALRDIYVTGNWTVYLDETLYVTDDPLRLGAYVKLFWHQGRSLGITLVASNQRPTHIPLIAYSSSSHLFLWREQDDVNLRRLSGIGSIRSKEIRAAVMALRGHDVLYVGVRDGKMVRTRVGLGSDSAGEVGSESVPA